ncbi:MAG: LCP family protein [Caldilineaceae bacterium]
MALFSGILVASGLLLAPAKLAAQSSTPTTATATVGPVPSDTPTELQSTPTVEPPLPLEQTTNILVLGSDRRPDTPNWRTDVMMIVALDFSSGKAGVISVPRDVYIDAIPKHQPNRVNVIDYLGERDQPDGGGPALIKQIIRDRMGIRIDHFLRFDFSSFQEVVDALGGVDVEVDCPYYDYFQIEDVILNIQPGVVHMSGAEALVYVRSRRPAAISIGPVASNASFGPSAIMLITKTYCARACPLPGA